MSDPTPFDFGKFIPGFDFLRGLGSAAAAGGVTPPPGLAQWMAPTLSVEELDKRLSDLKTVQFWLDQNAAALKASIQALEVQRMTLATLQGMNVTLGELGGAFPAKTPDSAPGRDAQKEPPTGPAAPGAAAPFDPMQWWGALTQQFQQIANTALQDAATRTPMPGEAAPAGDPPPAPATRGARTAPPRARAPAAKKAAPKPARREGDARSG